MRKLLELVHKIYNIYSNIEECHFLRKLLELVHRIYNIYSNTEECHFLRKLLELVHKIYNIYINTEECHFLRKLLELVHIIWIGEKYKHPPALGLSAQRLRPSAVEGGCNKKQLFGRGGEFNSNFDFFGKINSILVYFLQKFSIFSNILHWIDMI